MTERLWKEVSEFPSPPAVLRPLWESIGIRRACCKSTLLSSVDHSEQVLLYAGYQSCRYVERRVHSDAPRTSKTD